MEYFVRVKLQKGQTLVAEDVQGLYGRSHLVTANLFVEAAANGGKGGVIRHMLEGEGLYDADDPWNSPKGDLVIKAGAPLLYPAFHASCDSLLISWPQPKVCCVCICRSSSCSNTAVF